MKIITNPEKGEEMLNDADEAMIKIREWEGKKIKSVVKKFVSNAKQIPEMVRQTKATNASIALNRKMSKRLAEVRRNKNKK